MRTPAPAGIFGIVLSFCCLVPVFAAETVKIAHIDPLSGPFALVGESFAHHLAAAAAEINAKGDIRFEIVDLDNKSSPQRLRKISITTPQRPNSKCSPRR